MCLLYGASVLWVNVCVLYGMTTGLFVFGYVCICGMCFMGECVRVVWYDYRSVYMCLYVDVYMVCACNVVCSVWCADW